MKLSQMAGQFIGKQIMKEVCVNVFTCVYPEGFLTTLQY